MVTTNAVRFPFANLLALLLMAGLFTALFNVIMNHRVVVEPKPVTKIEFTRLIPDTPDTIRPVKVTQPPIKLPPGPPEMERPNTGLGDDSVIPPGDEIDFVPVPKAQVSRPATAMYRPDPDYPARPQSSGTEGWVELQFNITAAGSVTDVTVIDAQPRGVFEQAAIKALLKWKYQPSVDGGRSVEQRGNRVVLRFNMP